MKYLVSLVFLFSVFFAFSSDDVLSEWECIKKIESVEAKNYKYASFYLDKDIYRHSLKDLSDLRIVDNNNVFVPFYTLNMYKKRSSMIKKYETKIINMSIDKENNITYDFQVIPASSSIRADSLSFVVENEDFSRQITIYGRTNSSSWQYIATDTIYKLDKYSKTDVKISRYSEGYNFFRVIFKNNIDIMSCSVYSNLMTVSDEKYIKTIKADYTILQKDKKTEILLKNDDSLRVVGLTFDVRSNFIREYSLMDVSDDSFIKYGVISRNNFEENRLSGNIIELGNNFIADRRTKIIIDNKDDPPLEIKGISLDYVVDKVVFEKKDGNSYFLYFSNKNAVSPVYDITNFKDYIEMEPQAEFRVSGEFVKNGNPLQKPESSRFDFKSFFNILIVAISVILFVFFIVKLFSKAGS